MVVPERPDVSRSVGFIEQLGTEDVYHRDFLWERSGGRRQIWIFESRQCSRNLFSDLQRSSVEDPGLHSTGSCGFALGELSIARVDVYDRCHRCGQLVLHVGEHDPKDVVIGLFEKVAHGAVTFVEQRKVVYYQKDTWTQRRRGATCVVAVELAADRRRQSPAVVVGQDVDSAG